VTEIALHPTTSPVSDERRAEILAAPSFGRFFTDNMVKAVYADGAWQQPELVPYGPIQIDPSTSVLHYGQAIFEGIKAYHQPDGSVAVFRPEANAARFNRSAARMAMPGLPDGLFTETLEALVDQDRAWVPQQVGNALYLRPFMVSTDVYLGMRPSDTYLYLLIASPVEGFFGRPAKPVAVWLSTEYVRAAVGGTGEAKCAGNYAASFVAQAQAAAKGCDQVVWLDAVERRWVEEMGGMNLYFVLRDGPRTTLVTPELSGSLLAGVTRSSILEIAKDLGFEVEERKIDVDEWEKGCETGRIIETFACGTAAVVTPVGTVKHAGGEWSVGGGLPGEITLAVRQRLLDVQHGLEPDTHGWMHTVPAR
jgi:branched-chain amino acid aminotransferase